MRLGECLTIKKCDAEGQIHLPVSHIPGCYEHISLLIRISTLNYLKWMLCRMPGDGIILEEYNIWPPFFLVYLISHLYD